MIFSGPMVRALLEGRKSQTRRLVKLPKRLTQGDLNTARPDKMWGITPGLHVPMPSEDISRRLRNPYGFPEPCRIWVKETTLDVESSGWVGPVYVESQQGAAAVQWGYGESDDPDFIEPFRLKKRSSMFMPRKYARLTLNVVNVSAERLQSISPADVRAEGLVVDGDLANTQLVDEYARVWEGLHGAGSWAANPFVWRIEFSVHALTGDLQ
jgi:hypothetical protein